jgi:hypothetical protein
MVLGGGRGDRGPPPEPGTHQGAQWHDAVQGMAWQGTGGGTPTHFGYLTFTKDLT